MTSQQKLQYNKRCIEFLGYVNTTPTDRDFDIYHKEKGMVIDNKILTMIEPMSARFDSDWNWIMEIVEVVEKLEILLPEKNKKGFLKNLKYGNINIEAKYDSREEFKGWYSSVSIELSYPFIYDSLNYEKSKFETKKQALVQAIDQFLIWYNKQKE